MGQRKKAYYTKAELSKTKIAEPGQFVTGTGKPYEGPYHIANGTPIAGPSAADPVPTAGPPMPGTESSINQTNKMSAKDRKALIYQVLEPTSEKFSESNREYSGRYWEITSREYNNHTAPVSYYPIVEPYDYERGIITRYFVQKRNEPKTTITEVSKKQYDDMNNTNKPGINGLLYRPLIIEWSLHPTDAMAHNLKTVRSNDIDFPGLTSYLSNLTEFSRKGVNMSYQVDENLYTSGGEFLLPNGQVYIGDYHIHPGKGPMVGAKHKREAHDLLMPIPESLKKFKSKPNMDQEFVESSDRI